MRSFEHRTPIARRGFAAFAALVVMLGNLASFAHEAMVEHATCAEHGERVHTAALGTPDAASRDVAGPSLHDALPGDAGGEADDHCTLCPAAHAQGIADAAIVASDAPAHVLPEVALPAETPSTARPIYVIAPKHGPPSLA